MIIPLTTIPITVRVAALCILLVLAHFPWLQVHASDPGGKTARTVRVVMDNNYPPYVFVNSEGQVQGILADQWRLWQEKTGIQVEITATDWKEALRDMKAGKYDVIDTAFETEERKTWLDFGKPHARIEVAAYFDKAISAITNADSLQGFVVAVKEGDAAIDLLRSRGVNNLVFFKGYEAIVQAAKEHKVNVFVVDTPPALYFLYKYGLQHDFKVSPPINVGEFHRAVRKGNTALLQEIEAGFALLTPGELASIEKKWYGAPLLNGISGAHLLVGGSSLGLVLLLLFLWNHSLRAAVRKRTAELERSREALRESEARYRELVEQASTIILRMDREGRICFLNDYALRFFGYQLDEVIGQSVIGILVPETDSAGKNLREMIADIGRHPERYAINENENICRDGRRVWIAWTNNPLCDAEGQFSEILCMGNEITDRRMAEEALRWERQRLEFVIDGSRLGVWEWNVQTNETVFNEIWAELIGYTLKELLPYNYTTWEELLHPYDVERAKDALFSCVEGKNSAYDCEIRMRHKSGHWVWILDRGKVFTRDAAGNPLSMFGTHTDITTIKRAEEEVQATSELLSQFIKNSPIYAFIKEVSPTESRTLKASDNFQDMIGMPVAEMLGKTMAELFPSEFAAEITADDWQVVSQGNILQREEVLEGRTYTTIKFPIRIGERNLLAGYTIDLSDRVRAEAALRESEATFRNIVQASPMGIHLYQLDKGDRLVFIGANPAADRLLGVDNSRYIGMICEDAFPQLRDTDIPERYRRAARFGENWQIEHVSYAEGGITGAFEVHAFQMASDKVAVLFNEISARKRAEEEREKLRGQLIQAQKMESVGRLAGGIAHDFNNMLSVIIGHCELALRGLETVHPLHASLQNIRMAAERSADLTRQLLAFARRQTVAPKLLDINTTVTGMLEMLRRLIGDGIDLVWQPESNPGQVLIDPSQLDQILVNLFVNARDAIGDTGKVTIETDLVTIDEQYCADHIEALKGAYVLLAVSDDGCGIDSATLPHLFEPFFTTKEMGKGTGLGLATVYGIVKQNKGFINVYSEPGQGTTFKIYLPRHSAGTEPAVEEVADQAATGSETVLIVEDEPMILEMATTMLESLGYTVLASSCPSEAIRLASEHGGTIQLLMTDVVMPEMNGRLLASHLRGLLPSLNCLFMSGYTANVIAHHGVLDEGMHFIQKPFTLQTLAAKIREALAAEGTGETAEARDPH
ncbi:PAS domain S-box protein [uncultured Desulfobulbus sp.]|uniref:PAS domain S-box protein n=1 Tax=uncultured Desulfobulbus sp. TaxID=239745 RepID=UPI0029C6BACA|nr:PAS domain S-box protein [uncultured Desulfobulbus sp.]